MDDCHVFIRNHKNSSTGMSTSNIIEPHIIMHKLQSKNLEVTTVVKSSNIRSVTGVRSSMTVLVQSSSYKTEWYKTHIMYHPGPVAHRLLVVGLLFVDSLVSILTVYMLTVYLIKLAMQLQRLRQMKHVQM